MYIKLFQIGGSLSTLFFWYVPCGWKLMLYATNSILHIQECTLQDQIKYPDQLTKGEHKIFCSLC